MFFVSRNVSIRVFSHLTYFLWRRLAQKVDKSVFWMASTMSSRCEKESRSRAEKVWQKLTPQIIVDGFLRLNTTGPSLDSLSYSGTPLFNEILFFLIQSNAYHHEFTNYLDQQGYNNWTNGLYGYSWDMMVHAWETMHVAVTVRDKKSGSVNYLDTEVPKGARYVIHADNRLSSPFSIWLL